MNSKTISVIVPVYKVEESLLRQCIESLLNQTLEDIEILLVDDGCPIGGGAICDEYARKDSRIRVIHKANAGVSAARNDGLDAVCGKYFTFVDGDDFVDREYCQVLYNAAEDCGADIVSCRVVRYNLQTHQDLPIAGEKNAVFSSPEDIRKMALSLLRTIALNDQDSQIPENHYVYAHLYRTTHNHRLRFNTALKRGEDRFFNFFALQQCRVFCRRAETMYHYVINPGSLTHSFRANAIEDALTTYQLYRNLAEVEQISEYRQAYYIRTCCTVLNQVSAYFFHPDNPNKKATFAFRQFCKEDIVAEAIQNADIREMRLCKMKLAIWCLKFRLYGVAAWISRCINL